MTAWVSDGMVDNVNILISGAGGFIGGWLAESFVSSNVGLVRAGIRSWKGAARLARFPMELVFFDVLDKDQIKSAMHGATHVIHCASGDADVIVEGTRNMLNFAFNLGIQRFVQLSTTEVYGNVEGRVDESSSCQHTGNEYGDSKIEAEKLCLNFNARGLPVTIIRPPIVYGPFGTDWTADISQKLMAGSFGVFEQYGEGYCNLLYISDLVAGVLLAMKSSQAAGGVFHLNGPELITWNEYFRKFSLALNLTDMRQVSPMVARLRTKIATPARASAKFALKHLEEPLRKLYERSREARIVMQSVERSLRTVPTTEHLNLYSRKVQYDWNKARLTLGFEPQVDIDTGISFSVQWLRHLGKVGDPLARDSKNRLTF